MKSKDPLIHQILEGRYRIEAEVGRGGMGVVYRGSDLTLSRPVAIKTIIHQPNSEEDLARFIQEARTLAQIEDPRLVPVYAVGQDEGYHYIVMKFLEGETLDALMKREGALSVDRVVHIVSQVCAALSVLHARGIIHRDIKPANLMISPEGRVTVMDLGIAKEIDAPSAVSASMMGGMGTPRYMPPEAVDNHPLDARADIYSLGVIAFQAVTGRVPFDGPTRMAILYYQAHQPAPLVRDLRPDVPKHLEAAISKALSKRPDDRFQSAAELAEALVPSASLPQGGGARVSYLVAAVAIVGLAFALLRPSTPTPQPPQGGAQVSQVQGVGGGQGVAQGVQVAGAQGVQGAQGEAQGGAQGAQDTRTIKGAQGSQKLRSSSNTKPPQNPRSATGVSSSRRSRLVRVRVSSKPTRAAIYYRGQQIGTTPYTIEKDEEESWSITLKLKGFHEKTVNLKGEDKSVTLTSAFGSFGGGFN